MKRFYFTMLLSMTVLSVMGQQKNTATEDYIVKYRDIAIENERDYGVPASVTLAQGIIESGSGRSSLAKEGNNHFGIKCHSNWTGKRMYKDDDNKNDCFRVYDNAQESFTDHSLFLKNGKRYQFLFSLDKRDYKGWAEGLKKAGYATNPNYPQLLINVIEVYDLHKISSSDYYLLADNDAETSDDEYKPTEKQDKPTVESNEPTEVKHKKSLWERIFGGTKWYQRRHETPEQRKRREMDEQIQKMIDKKDVQRNDFEIEFE